MPFIILATGSDMSEMGKNSFRFPSLWNSCLNLSQTSTVKTTKYLKSRGKKKMCKIGRLSVIISSSGSKLAPKNSNLLKKMLFWATLPDYSVILFSQGWWIVTKFCATIAEMYLKSSLCSNRIWLQTKGSETQSRLCLFLGA